MEEEAVLVSSAMAFQEEPHPLFLSFVTFIRIHRASVLLRTIARIQAQLYKSLKRVKHFRVLQVIPVKL
jgi:hypothetical protein